VKKIHSSVRELNKAFFKSINEPFKDLDAFYFCDNEKDATECAELVMQGIKQATASSLWWYQVNNETLPQVGKRYIVTSWHGIALCVIEVTKVEIVQFKDITPEFAEIEGEGDKSLAYWKKVHWAYYTRELKDTQYSPTEDMQIVCEQFKVIFR